MVDSLMTLRASPRKRIQYEHIFVSACLVELIPIGTQN